MRGPAATAFDAAHLAGRQPLDVRLAQTSFLAQRSDGRSVPLVELRALLMRLQIRLRVGCLGKLLPTEMDNHWLDCLVGCAAAASMLGVSLFRSAAPKKVKRTRKHVAYL